MKKLFVLVLIMMCVSASYSKSPIKKKRAKSNCTYIYKDANETLSSFVHDWLKLTYCQPNLDSIVKTPKQAIQMAYVYVSSIYGEEIAKKEQPYSVSLINDSLWYIDGTPTHWGQNKEWRGGFSVIINRKNGAILRCMHGK